MFHYLGKTTLCRDLVNLPSSSSSYQMEHVCFDDVMPDSSDKWTDPTYVWKKERQEVVQMVAQVGPWK